MAWKRKYNKRKIDGRYYNYFDICKLEGIEQNRAVHALEKHRVEGIKNLPELEPIEHLFEVFEKPVKGRMINSYGILRRYYDKWKQTGEVPKLPTGRPIKEGYVWLKSSIPETLKKEFQSVVDKANSMSVVHVTYSDMVAVALREWIDRHDIFNDDEEDE